MDPAFRLRDSRLRRPLTSFVGREQELAEVRRLLSTTRLLTLTGPGGIGKTRLAVETAVRQADSFPDGVALVELASVTDPRLVPHAVREALGVAEQPRRSVVDVLLEYLGERRLLLVLDNCEHVLAACAELANVLLHACSSLAILATSRERVGVAGETSWRVPSLSVPLTTEIFAERLPSGEAVDLFIDRARAVAPGFALTPDNAAAVAEICRRLDGVPLAIELAAAHVRVLAPNQLVQRLGEHLKLLEDSQRITEARHHTVRETLVWSYQLLTEPQKRLFERLAVFVGGWTLEAAEFVCGPDVLGPLTQLLDKSLVLTEQRPPGPPRYRLLETVRQFALERLLERPDADTFMVRHANFFGGLAERAQPDLLGADFTARLNELEVEHDNLRATLRSLINRGEADGARRLGGALALFWFLRGPRTEGRAWLAQILALPGDQRGSVPRAKLLFGLGLIALHQGDHAAVKAPIEEALDVWQRLGNQVWVAYSLYVLGLLAWQCGNLEHAKHRFDEGLKVARAASDSTVEAFNLRGLALVALDEGAYADGRARAHEALALAAHPRSICQALNILGEISYREGQYVVASDLLQTSIAKARGIGEPILVAVALPILGHVLVEQGDLSTARAALTECLGLARQHGDRLRLGHVFEGFAHMAAAHGQAAKSLRLFSAASALRESLGSPMSPSEVVATARWLDSNRAALGGEAAAVAVAEGRSMSTEEAIACALAEDHRPASGRLSVREAEVAALVAEGLTNLQIAERLVIGERTVESHVSSILGKLGLHSRTGLAAWAVEQRLALRSS